MTVFHRARPVFLFLACLVPWFARGETLPRRPLGLTAADGVLLRDGKPYRGIGANYFDLFARVLHDPKDTSHRQGLARLARAGIPFVRFMACGFWPVDNALYLKDKDYLHEQTWTEDTPEQFREILLRDNPSPIDTLCVHIYPAEDNRYAAESRTLDELVGRTHQEARRARKPLFIGEFGVESRGGKAREQATFEELLAAIEKHQVPLSAFWVYDYSGQDNQWNTTFDNQRSNLLRLVAQANVRIRRSMETRAAAR